MLFFGLRKTNANVNIYADVDTILSKLNNRYSDKYEASKARAKFKKL